jgi:hypothetical protein
MSIFVGSKVRCVDLSLHSNGQVLYYLDPIANQRATGWHFKIDQFKDSRALQSEGRQVIMVGRQ